MPSLMLAGRVPLTLSLILGVVVLVAGCANRHDLPSPAPTADVQTIQPGTISGPPPSAPEDSTAAPSDELSILIDAIGRMDEHGLDPGTYGLPEIARLAGDPEARHAALRRSWSLAATHLAHGYLDQDSLTPRLEPGAAELNMFDALEAGGDPQALAAALAGLAPQHPAYIALRKELLRQRAVQAQATDPAIKAASAARIDTLRVNLERWRWLPHDLGERSVVANIAGFDVTTLEHETPTSRHTAIFGMTQRQTPNFSDKIEYIVFNPWWEVPDSIARRDKLAQFRRDPGTVTRLGYQVLDRQGKIVDPATIDWNTVSSSAFPYRLRQAPGPQNALGQVKIMFPNPYNVYLHDTPDKSLFESEQRTFSSGCIRVHDPIGLAEWILEETPGWDRTRIDEAVASGTETRVDLAQSVPVYVVYLTAVADTCGDVTYLNDVYDRDAPILTALQAPQPS